jgi:hypothetical protein
VPSHSEPIFSSGQLSPRIFFFPDRSPSLSNTTLPRLRSFDKYSITFCGCCASLPPFQDPSNPTARVPGALAPCLIRLHLQLQRRTEYIISSTTPTRFLPACPSSAAPWFCCIYTHPGLNCPPPRVLAFNTVESCVYTRILTATI